MEEALVRATWGTVRVARVLGNHISIFEDVSLPWTSYKYSLTQPLWLTPLGHEMDTVPWGPYWAQHLWPRKVFWVSSFWTYYYLVSLEIWEPNGFGNKWLMMSRMALGKKRRDPVPALPLGRPGQVTSLMLNIICEIRPGGLHFPSPVP